MIYVIIYSMDKNPLVYGLIFGLTLTPLFTFIELKMFTFISKFLKLDVKLKKPIEVISLIIIEIIALILSLKSLVTLSAYSFIVIFILLIKIFGLWKLKKWVLYIYVISMLLTFSNISNGGLGTFELRVIAISLPIQLIVLLIYYLNVYKPNKKLFK